MGDVTDRGPQRKDTTLTKETFLNHLYGGRDEPEMKIIDVSCASSARTLRMPRMAKIT